MKQVYLAIFCLIATLPTLAQNPAGNCFRADYDSFQNDGLLRYFDCGNDNMLNTGDELTLEVWIQFRDLGDNQKIIGKFGLNNSGYLLGVDQGRIYPEIWNPTQYGPLDGLMNPLALHWQHLAVTFTRGDSLRTYINGTQVGATVVTNQPITANTDNLVIGIAPWDVVSFQSFGNIDEVRIWNVARTGAQIQEAMFMELSGSEAGLVAYYDFNESTGNSLPDRTGNGNTGAGTNVDASEWVDSRAVIANDMTESASDLHGIWNGLAFMDPRVAATSNGMTMVASNLDTADYAVFGHNGSSGTNTDDLESNVPANFTRTARTWPTTVLGSVSSNVLMNLNDAANGGTALDNGKPAVNYTLLHRNGNSGTFKLAGKGASITNGVVTFLGVNLQEGEYTLGVGDTEYEGTVGIGNIAIEKALVVYPNPSNGLFTLSSSNSPNGAATISVFDVSGKLIVRDTWNGAQKVLDLSGHESGFYTLKVESDQGVAHKRLVVK